MSPEPKSDSSPRHVSLLPTNGGDDSYSYYKNSYYQRISANFEHQKINEELAEKFDVKNLLSHSKTIQIADLGCATGPNAIINMQNLVDAIKIKYHIENPKSETSPEFQVFFNDLATNDFNTLFKSLPIDRGYFAAGVPGSFRAQIFPEASLHFAYSSHCLHWLSKLPLELEDEASPAWNKGRVHYTSAPKDVVRAYKSQFGKEMDKFLEARAKELVVGGMLVIIMSGAPVDLPLFSTANGTMFEFMGSCLMEMAKEGILIEESQVDSFNLPLYQSASPDEMASIVERNGCFGIERIELSKPSSWLKSPVDIPAWMTHARAAMERNLITHFGTQEVVNELFKRLTSKLLDHKELLTNWCDQKVQLLVVLKRK